MYAFEGAVVPVSIQDTRNDVKFFTGETSSQIADS